MTEHLDHAADRSGTSARSAAAKTEVDERNIGSLLADQMLGRGGRRNGPATSAPQSLDRPFTALQTCQQSSTTRMRTPFKSGAAASSGAMSRWLKSLESRAASRPPLSAEV